MEQILKICAQRKINCSISSKALSLHWELDTVDQIEMQCLLTRGWGSPQTIP